MSEPDGDRELADRTSTALHDLRLAIRERVTVPPSVRLRRRAERTDRMRNGSDVAAGSVALLALVGGVQLGKTPTGPSDAPIHAPTQSQSQTAEPASSPP